jgi:glycerol kinase
MPFLKVETSSAGATAFVVDAEGSAVVRSRQELSVDEPHENWFEQAPDEIWRATLTAARAALDAYSGDAVQGIEISHQLDSVALWDRETLGSPLPAIAGADQRAAETCTRLRDAGHERRVRELTGQSLDPSLVGPKLSWLAEHDPNTWALVQDGRYAVGTVDSYLIARMTRGTWHVTDPINASRTLLFDAERGEWSDELCALFDVPRDALPDVVPSRGRLAITDPRSFLGLEVPISAIG